MNLYEKWRKRVPAELGVLACGILAAMPVFPVPAFIGALGWILGLAFYKLCNIGKLRALPLYFHLNLVTIGVALAAGQEWGLRLAIMIPVAVIATLVLTTMVTRLLYYYWVPVLLFPSIAVFWASQVLDFGGVTTSSSISDQGMIYILAVAAIGCFILSPIFLAMTAIGVGFGALLQFLIDTGSSPSWGLATIQGIAFAYCSSVSVTPSRRSMAWASLAIGILTLGSSVDAYAATLPTIFKLFVWTNVGCAFSIYGSRIFSQYRYESPRSRPEDKLEDQMTQWQRFRAGEARVGLPFKGTWKVSQSFDGEWTHRGIWRHGLDFVLTDELGKSFRGNGFQLEDYYAYGRDVLAPTSGYVVAMFQEFPDNPVGTVKNQNNFGNYVVIRDAFGAHVLIGHLKQGSLKCALYQYIEADQVIGLCGNSGYSPEPHIHMHIQADAIVGSATIPFHLTNYLIGDAFQFHGIPQTNALVTKLEINTSLCRSMGFRVNESFQILQKNGDTETVTEIENQLDPYWGSLYFTDGSAKLFHHRDSLSFYFYRYEGRAEGPLFDLMTALPRVPLTYGVKCHFEDRAPVMHWRSKSQRWLAFFKLILTDKFNDAKTSFKLNCDILEVSGLAWSGGKGTETSCFLDPVDGFAEYKVGERYYEVRSQREHGVIGSSDVRSEGAGKGLGRVV